MIASVVIFEMIASVCNFEMIASVCIFEMITSVCNFEMITSVCNFEMSASSTETTCLFGRSVCVVFFVQLFMYIYIYMVKQIWRNACVFEC
jgi:hypothetical protein